MPTPAQNSHAPTSAEIKRAIKVVLDLGLQVASVEFTHEGVIVKCSNGEAHEADPILGRNLKMGGNHEKE